MIKICIFWSHTDYLFFPLLGLIFNLLIFESKMSTEGLCMFKREELSPQKTLALSKPICKMTIANIILHICAFSARKQGKVKVAKIKF